MVLVGGLLHDCGGFKSRGLGLDGFGSLLYLYLAGFPESGCNRSSIQ